MSSAEESRLVRRAARGDLAENEAAFKAAGFPIKIETFQCPNCGGTLELGMDTCEYCGQVILT